MAGYSPQGTRFVCARVKQGHGQGSRLLPHHGGNKQEQQYIFR